MTTIINRKSHLNFHPTLADLKLELRFLEGQVAIHRAELSDVERAHAAWPFRPEYVAIMHRGYRASLRELHREILSVQSALAGIN